MPSSSPSSSMGCKSGTLASTKRAWSNTSRSPKMKGFSRSQVPFHHADQTPLQPHHYSPYLLCATQTNSFIPTVINRDKPRYKSPEHSSQWLVVLLAHLQYVMPHTNLFTISQGLGPSTYRPTTLATSESWSHPCLTYILKPPKHTADKLYLALWNKCPGDRHIFISLGSTSHTLHPHVTTYHIMYKDSIQYKGHALGGTQMQVLC